MRPYISPRRQTEYAQKKRNQWQENKSQLEMGDSQTKENGIKAMNVVRRQRLWGQKHTASVAMRFA